jgi:DNA invertase Pin-like site-specific DNA recombinase
MKNQNPVKAIYARRSTDHQEASIPVQLEEARRYIEKQGWSLDDRHVYIDDALSRMEYKKRPALFAMLVAAEEDKFDVIVLRDVDRLGGDANRNGVILSDLIDRQVRVDEYLTKNRVKLDSAISKFMSAAKNFGAELEREKTSQRTHETLLTKARRGLNVGGRCYGFNNERVYQGEKHVETRYVVNDEQAKVVREMFEWYAAGWGLKRITRELNARKLPSPQAGKRGTGSWSPSVVRPMLRRERYRGMIH